MCLGFDSAFEQAFKMSFTEGEKTNWILNVNFIVFL
jgi:hypothetical protein